MMRWTSCPTMAALSASLLTIAGATLLPTILLSAAEPAATGEATANEETVYSLLMKGGALMYPIFLCSVIVVTVAIERAISMRKRRVGSPILLDQVIERLPSREQAGENNLKEAADVCAANSTLLGSLLHHGLVRLHRDETHVEATLEEAATKEMHRLQRRLRPFAIIATLAPLLGLLGTVFGLILCFGEASVAEATERAQKLSDGIYRALVTTAAGLSVAIPSMLLGYFFHGRVDSVIDLLDETATRFLDHYYGGRTMKSRTKSKVGKHGADMPRSTARTRG